MIYHLNKTPVVLQVTNLPSLGRETGTQGVVGSRHETAINQSAMPLLGRSEDTLRARLSKARSAKSTSPNCSALKLSRFKTASLTDLWRTVAVGSETA